MINEPNHLGESVNHNNYHFPEYSRQLPIWQAWIFPASLGKDVHCTKWMVCVQAKMSTYEVLCHMILGVFGSLSAEYRLHF